MKRFAFASLVAVVVAGSSIAQVYNNGPLVSNPGAAFGGADASAITAPGTTFGATSSPAFRIADDFTVPCGESWAVTDFVAYGYNTQAAAGPFSTISTLTAGNYRIWSGQPGTGGAVILHDFSAANQLTATGFTNIYRVTPTTLLNQQRPIFSVTMAGNAIVLGPGKYWFDFQLTGAAVTFTPEITIVGQLNTGNAIQFNAVWGNAIIDAGTTQGMPFQINYVSSAVACFKLDITQPGGFGNPVVLADTGGTPGNTFANIITLNAGAFPNGWFFGVDVSIAELGGLLNGGLPFTGTLDFAGNFVIGPIPISLPFPIPLYYVGLELSGFSIVSTDTAKTITIG